VQAEAVAALARPLRMAAPRGRARAGRRVRGSDEARDRRAPCRRSRPAAHARCGL